MAKFVYVRPFAGRPRTGGEVVMDEIYNSLKMCGETKLVVVPRPDETYKRPIPLLSAFRHYVSKNATAMRFVAAGYEVYSGSLAGTIEYVQPAPTPSSIAYKAYNTLLRNLERLSRNNAVNVKLAIYNSKYSLNNHRVKGAKWEVVVYPPLIKSYTNDLSYKQNIVVSISRIMRDKRLEVVGVTSERIPEADFVVIGFLRPRDAQYLRWLRKRFPRLKIYPNAPEELKREVLFKAKIFLHTPTSESFAISKLEAMSAGAIPIVPLSGGIHEGVPKQYVYRSLDEMVDLVRNNLYSYTPAKARFFMELAQKYSLQNFHLNITNTIKQYLK